MIAVARSVIVALPLLISAGAHAQHQTFTINPDASNVAFALAGSGHHVNGTFHLQSGSIDFDRSAQTISGSIIVGAGSGNSGEPGRDKKMNTDVLDVQHYAEISFAPRSYQGKIAPTGDSEIQVSGVFTLHGTPHDLTVPMHIHLEGSALNAKAHFAVPYVKWGLKDPSIFVLKVAKDVDIDLTLAGTVAPAS